MDLTADAAAQYRAFALDSRDYSPCFEDWATRVAADPEVLAWLERLPLPKRQPNIVFAAARWHGVPAPGPYVGLRDALLGDDGTIAATILARSTQTNEVGRLATLVPAFGLFPGPLALIEVGASAGLNLYPDRYSYTWGGDPVGSGPLLSADGHRPGPAAVGRARDRLARRHRPEPARRDRRGPDALALEPGLARARRAPGPAGPRDRGRPCGAARLVRGDLLDELPALVDEASRHGTVVVFHSAVAAYLPPADRDRFQALMAGLVACRPLPLGQQRGPRGAPGGLRDRRPARRRPRVRARHRRPGRRAHARPRQLAALVDPELT